MPSNLNKKKVHFFVILENMKSKIPCTDCESSFTQKPNLQSHINSVHKGVTYSCPDCDYTFTNKPSLQNHINSVHKGVIFPCEECEHTFSHKSSLQTHIKSVHKGVSFQCQNCESTFTRKDHIQRHIKSVHINDKISMWWLVYDCQTINNNFYAAKYSCHRSTLIEQSTVTLIPCRSGGIMLAAKYSIDFLEYLLILILK